MAKRVLHVIPGYGGGISSLVRNIIVDINTEKVINDVVGFSKYSPDFEADVERKKGRAYTLTRINKWNFFSCMNEFKNLLCKGEDYSVVHIHIIGIKGMYFSLISKICGIKRVIIHGHTASDEGCEKFYNRIKMSLSRIISRISADELASCSRISSIHLFGERITNKNKIMHIPNSINTERFLINISSEEKRGYRREFNIPDDAMVIGHIGRFGHPKNHDFMVDIIKHMKAKGIKFVWLFIGTGRDLDRIMKRINTEECKDVTRFLKRREDVNRLYKIMDITVLPSYFEGLPTVTVETQMAGVPTVISAEVTDEVDMRIGLVKYLSLDAGLERWVDEILQMSKVILPSDKKIISQMKKRGFTTKVAAKLYEAFIWERIKYYNLGEVVPSELD